MDFDKAVRMSAKKYLEGRLKLEKIKSVEEDMVYTLEFFDMLEKQMLEDDDTLMTKEEVVEDAV